MFTLAVAALFSSAVLGLGGYTNNTGIPYSVDLPCANCIRGGYEFCLFGAQLNGSRSNCSLTAHTPEYQNISGPGKADGFVCSGALDQTAAIVEGCLALQPARPSFCSGDYMVDLTNGGSYQIRNLGEVPLWGSCTYRVYSSCGYPTAAITIRDPNNINSFDIAYASADILPDRELDFFNDTQTITWSGSYITNNDNANDLIVNADSNRLQESVLTKCNSQPRNLYITLTRIVAPKTAEGFLQERQLNGLGNGTLIPDVQIGFTSTIGENSAKVLGAISFALMALVSVLAF